LTDTLSDFKSIFIPQVGFITCGKRTMLPHTGRQAADRLQPFGDHTML
ncbi:hypothetical protein NPIL_96081, partial [Nephila pilipes]